MEREAEQASFTARDDLRPDIQKRRWCRRSRLKDLDHTSLLDDEETIGAVAGVADEDRRRESTRNRRHEPNGGKQRS